MATNLLQLANYVQDQGELGRQRKVRELLTGAATQAFNAQSPEQQRAAVGQAISADLDSGFALNKEINADEDRRGTQLYNMARGLKAIQARNPAAAAAYYEQQLVPGLRRMGLEVPDVYDEKRIGEGVDQVLAMFDPAAKAGLPTGFREMDLAARAAGYAPGTPEYQKYFRVAGGIDGRAASGGFGFDKVKGADGRERLVRKNPRTGVAEVYDEITGDFSPLGGAGQLSPGSSTQPAPTPTQPPKMTVSASGPITSVDGTADTGGPTVIAISGATPEQNSAIGRAVDALRAANTPDDQIEAYIAAQEARLSGGAPAAAPATPRTARPALGVSRTPEEEAAAVKAAENAEALKLYDEQTRRAYARAEEEAAGKISGEARGARQKQAQAAAQMTRLLDQAIPYIRRSTGSGAGALRDAAGNFIGLTSDGAAAIAALKPIASALLNNVPRMEGPQSDADRKAYEQAAGDIANPTVPAAQRLAAVETIRMIQQRYADQSPSAGVAPTGNRIRYDAQGNRLP